MYLLQDRVPNGVGDYFFFNSVIITEAGICYFIAGNSVSKCFHRMRSATLFLRKKIFSICNNQSKIPGTCLVNLRIINFIQYTMINGIPYFAGVTERCAYACFIAGCPAGVNSRPAKSKFFFSMHKFFIQRLNKMTTSKWVVIFTKSSELFSKL